MGTTTADEAHCYRFGPLERRGVVAGFRGGQLAVVGGSLLAAVLVLRVDEHPPGLLIAVFLVGIGGFCAAWPIGGLTVEQWVPILVRWGAGGGRVTVGAAPLVGHLAVHDFGTVARDSCPVSPCAMPPRALRGVSILPVATEIGDIGVVHDSRHGGYGAVLAVSGRGFALLEPAERDGRVASWASFLAGLARVRCPVDRLQWIARSLPDGGDTVRRRIDEMEHHALASAPIDSYRELLAAEAAEFVRRDVFLVVRVSARKVPSARVARRGDAHRVAIDTLVREIKTFSAELSSARVNVAGVLDPGSLDLAIAESCRSGPVRADRGLVIRPGPQSDPTVAGGPWPVGARSEWDHYVTDEMLHATYWIAEWPRLDVGADFLAPLLLQGSHRITMSVTMEPVDSLAAARRVENARVSRIADDELRRRGGFAITARRRREDEALGSRETELADGHAHFRFSGYVGVSATGIDELSLGCEAVEQAAARSFLSLRRLYGDQERAFTCLLPLGRGLS